jgi:hypothetical protein
MEKLKNWLVVHEWTPITTSFISSTSTPFKKENNKLFPHTQSYKFKKGSHIIELYQCEKLIQTQIYIVDISNNIFNGMYAYVDFETAIVSIDEIFENV